MLKPIHFSGLLLLGTAFGREQLAPSAYVMSTPQGKAEALRLFSHNKTARYGEIVIGSMFAIGAGTAAYLAIKNKAYRGAAFDASLALAGSVMAANALSARKSLDKQEAKLYFSPLRSSFSMEQTEEEKDAEGRESPVDPKSMLKKLQTLKAEIESLKDELTKRKREKRQERQELSDEELGLVRSFSEKTKELSDLQISTQKVLSSQHRLAIQVRDQNIKVFLAHAQRYREHGSSCFEDSLEGLMIVAEQLCVSPEKALEIRSILENKEDQAAITTLLDEKVKNTSLDMPAKRSYQPTLRGAYLNTQAKALAFSRGLEDSIAHYQKLSKELQSVLKTTVGAGQKIATAADRLADGVQAFSEKSRREQIAEAVDITTEVIGEERAEEVRLTFDEALLALGNLSGAITAVSNRMKLVSEDHGHSAGRFAAGVAMGAAGGFLRPARDFATRWATSTVRKRSAPFQTPVVVPTAAFPVTPMREVARNLREEIDNASESDGEAGSDDLPRVETLQSVGVDVSNEHQQRSSRWRYLNPRNWTLRRRK